MLLNIFQELQVKGEGCKNLQPTASWRHHWYQGEPGQDHRRRVEHYCHGDDSAVAMFEHVAPSPRWLQGQGNAHFDWLLVEHCVQLGGRGGAVHASPSIGSALVPGWWVMVHLGWLVQLLGCSHQPADQMSPYSESLSWAEQLILNFIFS